MPKPPFLQKIIYYILLLIVFVTPLVGFQPNLGYEGAKVFFFYLSLSVCALLWFILSFKNPLKISNSLIFKLSSLFLLSIMITSLVGIDPKASLIGKYPYYQGFILYAFLFFFYILISSLRVKLKDIAIALSASASLVSLLAIGQWVSLHLLHMNIPTYAGRVVSTFGQPNLYSGFVLFSLPFLFILSKDKKLRWWVLAGATVSFLAILISQSRAAILILCLILLLYLASRLRIKKMMIISLSAAVIFITAFSLTISSGLFWEEVIMPGGNKWLIDNSPEKRVIIWPIIADFITKRPIQGYGLENLITTFPTYQRFHGDRSPAYYGIKNLVVDRSHNYSLDLLFFSGIFGFLVWILLIGLLFKKVKSKVLLVSLIVYLIWIQLQIQSVVHLIYFWLLVGLIDQESS